MKMGKNLNYKECNNNYYIYFEAILSGIIFCLFFYKNFSISYFINDDTTMRNIASGAYTGRPDGHLIFVKYALGKIISLFYIIAPYIDWYGTILFTTHFLCLILILGRVLNWFKHKNKYFVLVITILIFFIIDIDNLTNSFQFTTTAAICGVTALFLFITIPRNVQKLEMFVNYLIILGLVWLSFCIRDKVLLMFVPFAIVLWLYRIFSEKENRKKYIILCVMILAVLGSVICVEKIAYRSTEWQEYTEFNKARSEILDYYGYPDYDVHRSFYQEQGISREQYNLLKVGTLNFSSGMTKEKYISVAQYAKSIFREENSFRTRMKEALKNTCYYSLYIMSNENQAIILLIYFFILLFSANKKQYGILVTLIAIFFFREMIYLYLFFKGRFLERIYETMILCDYFLLAGFMLHLDILGKVHLKKGIIEKTLLIGILLLVAIPVCCAYFNTQESNLTNTETILKNYCSSNQEKRYILDLSGYSSGYDAFTVKRENTYINYLTMYGWSCNSELYLNKKKSMGIEDIDKALLTKDTFLIETASSVGNNILDIILEYYNSCGINVTYKTVDEISVGQYAYKVVDFDIQ